MSAPSLQDERARQEDEVAGMMEAPYAALA